MITDEQSVDPIIKMNSSNGGTLFHKLHFIGVII
jgi:hypothetical protein